VSYVTRGRGARWGAHGAYLAREGAQRPGEKGRGFSADRDDLDLAQTLKGWEAAGDARLFKLVVSPEQAARLDLRAHARGLLVGMEQDLGTRLEWVAIDHHNTEHAHLHILVRGRDDKGRPLTLDPAYMMRGIRDRSETLVTETLGWRKESEILASRASAIERIQFTELDRALLRRADPDRVISEGVLRPEHPGQAAYRHQERGRLAFLERLGLAEPIGRGAWQLSPTLEPTLRQAQRVTDVIKSRDRHGAWLANPHLPLMLTRMEPGMTLSGRVVGTGLADELRDRRYLLLEGQDRIHYIVQTAAIERARGEGELRLGQRVTLTVRTVTLGGRPVMTLDIRTHPRGGPERMATEPARAERTRRWPTLEALQRSEARPIQPAGSLPGLVYRGRLVTYATDGEGGRHAVLDTGRELTAVPVSRATLAAGRHVRATARIVDDENRSRRQLAWRLADDERVQTRHRGHV
jgi:type IV secretory pathway VirD2 relaxase